MPEAKGICERRLALLAGVRRVVVKVGSAVIASEGQLRPDVIRRLADDVVTLQNGGCEVVMVVSGAVAGGFCALGMLQPPSTVVARQAAACIGQYKMMATFADAFAVHGREVAQLLMTEDDIENRRRFISARHTLQQLIGSGIISIINENDPLADDENKIGDNDHLSALVANLISAQLLVVLSSVPGVYRNGGTDVIPEVDVGSSVDEHVTDQMSASGVGGMIAKVSAAHLASEWGIPTIVCDGEKPSLLPEILNGGREGTLFVPRRSQLSSRKQWIAFRTKSRGILHVDAGARKALVERCASLLPSGIVKVDGRFSMGSRVDIADEQGNVFAVGLASYAAQEVRLMQGKSPKDYETVLGYKYVNEIVDRDDMVVLRDSVPEITRRG